MRKIDAAELLGRLHDTVFRDGEDRAIVYKAIDESATIEDVMPAGYWEGYNDDDPRWMRNDGTPIFLVCSHCGKSVLNNGSEVWNYCPVCGSKNQEWRRHETD